jgi:hypothetical protein
MRESRTVVFDIFLAVGMSRVIFAVVRKGRWASAGEALIERHRARSIMGLL